ncbi:hypothetical protein [uncultured Desulfobulbus sp.]|uniref:hypothetical protein n=1 Tax=uncultured Desulfobulbus sp. TaxID=239745 RepID=UPI0029C81EB5|nr:hypothetical protein [uncultured Desulfobulbus sp.]
MIHKILINCIVLFLFSVPAIAQVAVNLGTKPDGFGSSAQALAIIDLIIRTPGQTNYQIMYKTSTNIVVFECDFIQDTITRTRKKSKGRSTIEKWSGQATPRLKHAANGGPLDDTPDGYSPSKIRSF